MPFYLTPKQDDFNKIPELQVCIAEHERRRAINQLANEY